MLSFSEIEYLGEADNGGRPYFGKPFFTMADVEKHRQLWARDPVTGRIVSRDSIQNSSHPQSPQPQQPPVKQVSSAEPQDQQDDAMDQSDLSSNA